MLTGTKFAFAALLLAGTASGAFAQAPYGDNRPVSLRTYGPGAMGAYAYGPGWGRRSAYAPRPLARRAARRARARAAYAYAPGAWGAYAYAPGPMMMSPSALGAYAAAATGEPSPYDWMKVYEVGKLIGQDPDPNVRMMLHKDFTYQ